MDSSNNKLLQFVPLQSFVSPTFWHKLAEVKLNSSGLCDEPLNIWGHYTNRCAKSCLLDVDFSAFNTDFKASKFCFPAYGRIYNKNTIENFKNCDKNDLLHKEGLKLIEDLQNDRILQQPSRLARFFILSFADLKNHKYYYWFAFPCPLLTNLELAEKQVNKLKDLPELQQSILESLATIPVEDQQEFFIFRCNETTKTILTLQKAAVEFENFQQIPTDELYFCFPNNSEFEEPSWIMRVFLSFLYYKWPNLFKNPVKILGLRYDRNLDIGLSQIWQMKESSSKQFNDCDWKQINYVGWELSTNQKSAPRVVCMKNSMDAEVIAEQSIYLNLKLMKWRLLPSLNLDTIAQTKCLLFGAGTLGCAVSRMLMGWGFKHITFIDNGLVNYANPIRQYLFVHQDAVQGNAMKATIAAERLKDINPNTKSSGYVIKIPMPGHTVGESLKLQVNEDLDKIEQLVQQHDVLLLLTDSRESRWLPTLLGAAHNKIVINSALGFDSYLIQRHGGQKTDDLNDENLPSIDLNSLEMAGIKCIKGEQLGCYFCNDVSIPGNSLKDRTLDQQCTVTRPGASNIAASYTVELLIALLHHPLRHLAPAFYAARANALKHLHSTNQIPEGPFGILPHSIRGTLSHFENILPATEKFAKCIACSKNVIQSYRDGGNEFIFKVLETTKYLEDISGISEYKQLNNEIIDFNDSDIDIIPDDE